MSLVSTILLEAEYCKRIAPRLLLEDTFNFLISFFEQCIEKDPKDSTFQLCIEEDPTIIKELKYKEYLFSRYEAGWAVTNWFLCLWDDDQVPLSALQTLKDWIANVYLKGDEKIRTCIITAILEHLFEHNKVRSFFGDWKKDPNLKSAYLEAKEFGNYIKKTTVKRCHKRHDKRNR